MDLFLLGCLFISLIAMYVLRISSKSWTRKTGAAQSLPPGSMGPPLVGETTEFYSLYKADKLENFVFSRMAKHSSTVFKTFVIGQPVAFICGSAGARFIYSNDNRLLKHWWPPAVSAILAPVRRDPFHFKSNILMFYRGEQLKKQVGAMDRITRRHLETEWHGQKEVSVFPLARSHGFTVACYLVLSLEDKTVIDKLQPQLIKITQGMSKLKLNFPGTAYNQAIKAWDAVRDQLKEIVRLRRNKDAEGFQDTLSKMLVAIRESGEEMSDSDIADRLVGVLMSLFESTSTTASVICKYLAMYPEVYDAVRRESMDISAKKTPGEALNWEDIQKMEYSSNVFREVLRLHPPVPALQREAIKDFTYEGYHIPKGWKVMLGIKALHLDSRYFAEPEKFDPSRFEGEGPSPNSYMPFGGGASMCPGKNFARTMVLIFIHNVVKRFRWELTYDGHDEIVANPTPRYTSGIPVRLFAYPEKLTCKCN